MWSTFVCLCLWTGLLRWILPKTFRYACPCLSRSVGEWSRQFSHAVAPDDWPGCVWMCVLDHSVDSLQSTSVQRVQFSVMYSSLASRSVGLIYALKLLNCFGCWDRWMCLLNSPRFYLRFWLRFVSSINNRHVACEVWGNPSLYYAYTET